MKIDTDIRIWDGLEHRKLRVIVEVTAFDKEKEVKNISIIYSCLRQFAVELVGMPQQKEPAICPDCKCSPCGCELQVVEKRYADLVERYAKGDK